jgi:hypothetical protein
LIYNHGGLPGVRVVWEYYLILHPWGPTSLPW